MYNICTRVLCFAHCALHYGMDEFASAEHEAIAIWATARGKGSAHRGTGAIDLESRAFGQVSLPREPSPCLRLQSGLACIGFMGDLSEGRVLIGSIRPKEAKAAGATRIG